MSYVFTYDASACSGCKACQVACKDKNNLPVGVLWRRVYEVSGGTWQRHGDAWVTDVFAYNLSIACNHCEHPKCAGVCPTDAYVVRDDGIVYIDESKCMGCGYCAWACPYAAPQYNPELRYMTKCNFCYDRIDAGLPPSCVAACPLRVLNFVTVDDGPWTMGDEQPLWNLPATEHPFPLPDYSRTEPHLNIRLHAGMARGKTEGVVSNHEEISSGKNKSEWPLVIFTLLGQMAAGMAILLLFSGPLSLPLLFTLGSLIGLGGLASFLHLGRPLNAWRALNHLNKSWLSREILMFGLFVGSWLISLALPGMGKLPLALCGAGLVYSMAQVYRLRSVPAWDSGRTLLAFAVSAVVLGSFGLGVVDWIEGGGVRVGYQLVGGVGVVGALLLSLSDRNPAHQTVGRLKLGLIGLTLIGMLVIVIVPDEVGGRLTVPIFFLVLIEEVAGRWLFYEQPQRRIL